MDPDHVLGVDLQHRTSPDHLQPQVDLVLQNLARTILAHLNLAHPDQLLQVPTIRAPQNLSIRAPLNLLIRAPIIQVPQNLLIRDHPSLPIRGLIIQVPQNLPIQAHPSLPILGLPSLPILALLDQLQVLHTRQDLAQLTQHGLAQPIQKSLALTIQ